MTYLQNFSRPAQSIALALVAMSSLGGSLLLTPQTARATTVYRSSQSTTSTTYSSSYSSSWQTSFQVQRLSQRNQLVLQVDLQKPVTRYANAVYTLYAYENNQWVQVYTNVGARLISNQAGRSVLASEVIDCDRLQQASGIDIRNAKLKAVLSLTYDTATQRNQVISYESIQTYAALTQISQSQLVYQTTTYAINNSGAVTETEDKYEQREYKHKKQKHKKHKKHCNQGRGNGSEGCDPGYSRPHGGSNDEKGHYHHRR